MGVLYKPAKGRITQDYSSSHRALDFGWAGGTTVYAAADGYVSWDWTAGYGNRLSVNHGTLIQPSTITRYAHLHSMRMKSGWVVKGQPIATMGETGYYPDGVHLHFELLVGSGIRLARVDPSPYMTDSSGGNKPTPIPIEKDDDMKLVRKTVGTGTIWAAIGPGVWVEIGTQATADAVALVWGNSTLLTSAQWDINKSICLSQTSNFSTAQLQTLADLIAVQLPSGAFTAADRAMLDEIASKGELTQALTSTVQAVNNQAAVNKQEILNAIDEIDAGAPQNLQVTLSGTAAAV